MKRYLTEFNLLWILISGVVAALIWLFLSTAWVSDDAYITFRSIENFLAGYGPVFNVGERVQAFTHPLWFFIQAGMYAVTQRIGMINPWAQLYYVSLCLSIGFSIAAVLLMALRIAHSPKGALLGLIALILSKGFIDYATSGLENSLGYFILACFLAMFLADVEFSRRRVFWLAFFAALGTLNRMDTLLLFLPALVYSIWKSQDRKYAVLSTVLGFIPFVLWELFSLFYYGFPFPNTAYAKINTGIAFLELVNQGLMYILSSIRLDAIAFIILIGCIVWFFWWGSSKQKAVMVGIVLYLVYIIYIGGDFMAVRFFSLPIFICAVLLTTIEYRSNLVYAMLLTAMLVIGLLNPRTPLRSQAGYVPVDSNVMIDRNQVSDERLYYYHNYGWFSTSRQKPLPGSVHAGRNWIYNPNKRKVVLVGPLGVRGYQAGPDIHMIDENALADPLMTRLPIMDTRYWRIGHFRHIIPQGYLSTLDSGENKILDPDLAKYYEVLKLVTRGDLWDFKRIVEVIRLNSGVYDPLLDHYLERWYAQGKPVDEYK